MIYLYIYIYIFIYLIRKRCSQTVILTEWIIVLPVFQSAASFKIRI